MLKKSENYSVDGTFLKHYYFTISKPKRKIMRVLKPLIIKSRFFHDSNQYFSRVPKSAFRMCSSPFPLLASAAQIRRDVVQPRAGADQLLRLLEPKIFEFFEQAPIIGKNQTLH